MFSSEYTGIHNPLKFEEARKSLYKVIIVLTLICINPHAKAHYFDWVRIYYSCARVVRSDISHAVSDAEGNVYLLGHFHKGTMLDGVDLLPIDASREGENTCIV